MAYVAPPTFSAGSVLSASQLNVLSDDIEYLYGIVGGPIPSVNAHVVTDGTDYYLAYRHKWRYLHIKYVLVGNNGNHVRVFIEDDDGAEEKIFADESPNGDTTNTAVIDLEGTDWISYDFVGGTAAGGNWDLNLTTGNIYKIHIDWNNGGNKNFTFLYAVNSDQDTL